MIIVNARFLTQKITGVQRFAIEISKILRKLNDQIIFLSPRNILDKNLANELGVIVFGVNKGVIWEQVDLRCYLLLKHKPLLINFCNTGMLFYNKQIVTIHDMSYKVNPKWFSKRFYLWYNFLIPKIANRSFKILTVSKSSKNDIVKFLKINPDKISIVYNSSYLNTNNNFEAVIEEKYLLSVSSLDSRKNLKNLIEAFKRTDIKIKLVIVGLKNANFDFTLKRNSLNDNIIFTGYVSDNELTSLMNNAEAFIYVSFYEGFGLPPLEAMSLGCPVVVSDIPAHREVCGEAALYADPYNIEDIKNRINDVLLNDKLREQLIIAGKKNVERFDWLASAQNVLKNINEII
jgi:glycosyltransferase involved in cell wall biosynthesis